MSSAQIKLKKSSILHIPFESYEKDFKFIVNGIEFQTSRVIADLLSPKISEIHKVDATVDEFIINTKEKGDFSNFLKLINFEQKTIKDNEIEFILSIIEKLGIKTISVDFEYKEEENTIEKVLQRIKNHEKNPIFYSKYLQKEIEFISSKFYEMKEEEEEITNLQNETIERIFNNEHIQLKTEDQLLNIINQLYLKNPENSYLYSFVEFINLSKESISKFIEIFDTSYLTNDTWNKITERLQQEIKQTKENNNKSTRYSTTKETNKEPKQSGTIIEFNNNNNLDGIINFLKKQSNNNIQNIINITASSIGCLYYPLTNIIEYENNIKYTFTKNEPNQWICIDFKNRKIIPTHYTIRTSHDVNNHLKTWVIEASNDNSTWDKLDEQTNNNTTNGKNIVHTFPISTKNDKAYEYIRIRQTEKNWNNNNYLDLSAIEFHGTLI